MVDENIYVTYDVAKEIKNENIPSDCYYVDGMFMTKSEMEEYCKPCDPYELISCPKQSDYLFWLNNKIDNN